MLSEDYADLHSFCPTLKTGRNTDALNSHRASREQVVVGFMEYPENVTNASPLIGDTSTYQQWVGEGRQTQFYIVQHIDSS